MIDIDIVNTKSEYHSFHIDNIKSILISHLKWIGTWFFFNTKNIVSDKRPYCIVYEYKFNNNQWHSGKKVWRLLKCENLVMVFTHTHTHHARMILIENFSGFLEWWTRSEPWMWHIQWLSNTPIVSGKDRVCVIFILETNRKNCQSWDIFVCVCV